MATWKKVIVSGSAAHLLNVTASNLTNDNLVIAGVNGALESSGLTYNGTLLNLGSAQVQAAGFSGSFSGSFQGNGAGLTGIVATGTSLQNAIASGEGIAPFSYTNIAPVSVAVSGAVDLTDNAITKWDNNDGKFQTSSLIDNGTTITGVTSIQLTGANSNLSGSFSGSHFGSLSGTASYATQALSASFASTASYVNTLNQDVIISGSLDLALGGGASSNLAIDGNIFNQTQLTTNGALVLNPGSGGVGMAGVNQYMTLGYIQGQSAGSYLTGSFTGSFTGDGSGLTGIASNLAISGSTGGGSIALQSQILTVAGTSNEIETSAAGQTITIGLPNDVTIGNNLTVTGDLFVNGTTTQINTTDLYIEDKFILLASGSAGDGDGGIVIDRGTYASGNIGFGYDSTTNRWGFQDGIIDTTNIIDPTSANGVSGSFVGLVFTEAAHGATKPITGEFAKQGAIYTATNEDIWIYS